MSRLAALLVLGVAALLLQGAASALMPAWLVPDLGLLLVLAVAVTARPAEGLVLAAAIGWGTDLLAGAPLGHHALLRLLAFAIARSLASQFHLRATALVSLALGLGVLDALGTAALTRAFAGVALVGLDHADKIAVRALIGAAFAPAVRGLVESVLAGLTAADQRRRDVRLDTRRPLL